MFLVPCLVLLSYEATFPAFLVSCLMPHVPCLVLLSYEATLPMSHVPCLVLLSY